MDLQFINQEIAEARLFRATGNFSRMDSNDIVNAFYLNTLMLYIFNQDAEKTEFAQDYARKTVQFGSFSLFRTSSTDLYLLAYQILNPGNSNIQLSNRSSSRKDLKSLQFNRRTYQDFLRRIAQGKDARQLATSYLLRLERQLDITDGRYRRWRRMAQDWRVLRDAQKQQLLAQMTQEMRRVGGGGGRSSELIPVLTTMMHRRGHSSSMPSSATDRVADRKQTAQPSTARKAAGAVAGGLAGRAIAKSGNKTLGTAAGAAAGYWAAGRRASR